MGKRSSYKKRKNSAYFTPYEAVLPLLPHLARRTRFAETFAGDGRLIRHLEQHGHQCVYACDIAPKGPKIFKRNAFDVMHNDWKAKFISNPPWDRKPDGSGPLHDAIRHFTALGECWFLFDADWMHTKQATPFKAICRDIVSVGRVRWIEGSASDGKDNCAWYHFMEEGSGTKYHFRLE